MAVVRFVAADHQLLTADSSGQICCSIDAAAASCWCLCTGFLHSSATVVLLQHRVCVAGTLCNHSLLLLFLTHVTKDTEFKILSAENAELKACFLILYKLAL